MPTIPVEVSIIVRRNRTEAFAAIAPVDLTTIFTGHRFLPAVVATSDQSGRWDTVGETRIVHLSDGSRATENLTLYDAPDTFGYTVSGFTGALRFVAERAHGQWWFADTTGGRTAVRWRYEFVPTTMAAVPLLWLIAKLGWRGYMDSALRLAADQAEPA